MPVYLFNLYTAADLGFSPGDLSNGTGGTITTSANLTPLTAYINDDDPGFNVTAGATYTPPFTQLPADTNQVLESDFYIGGTLVGAAGDSISFAGRYMLYEPTTGGIPLIAVEINGVVVGYGSAYPILSDTIYFHDGNPRYGEDTVYHGVIPCFTTGARILTNCGEVPVEELCVGDKVHTAKHGLQTIRWIGSVTLGMADLYQNSKLKPVIIKKSALGHGLPRRDLCVSRQHRMQVCSKISERMFGVETVLVSAIKLTQLADIYVDEDATNIEYYHILFDRHEVIFAEGAPTESLYTGEEALKAVSESAREEIITLFPELSHPDYQPVPAHPLPSHRKQNELIRRHVRNDKPLLEMFS